MKKIEDIQNTELNNIAGEISNSLQNFIPDVKDVRISFEETLKIRAFSYLGRNIKVKIDDGSLTELSYKGDGIKSLTAISLIKHNLQRNISKQVLLAIEEPEAHLHPEAIHKLRTIISELSKEQQVIVTTHSPLFVDINSIENNIIVKGNKAKKAKRINEIRETLGVRSPDNLSSAEMVLFVEGESDKILLQKIIELKSKYLKKCLNNGRLIIIEMRGGNKISYLIDIYKKAQLSKVFFFLDNDASNQSQVTNLEKQDKISPDEYKLTPKNDKKETEIEDLFNYQLYSEMIFDEFGVDINKKSFLKDKKKWSDRIKKCFENSGKNFTEDTKHKLKEKVAKKIYREMTPETLERNKEVFNDTIKLLEAKLR